MLQHLARVAFDCLRDLGVTVVYTAIAGFLIAGIVASDEGAVSILRTGVLAAILTAVALLLIAAEVVLRLLGEWRTAGRLGATRRCEATAFR